LLSKEVYTYEFDNFGNWTKMLASVALIEGGKLSYEPTEVTYRMISYYLDEATLAKMSQPASGQPTSTVASLASPSLQNPPTATPTSKAAANTSQPTNVSANKTAAPLPSGSLIKSNVAASESALRMLSNVDSSSSIKVAADEPPPAVNRVPKPLLKPVSGGVLNGKAVHLPLPLFPPAAKSARASGTVVVQVIIDEKGKVLSAKATSGHALLRDAAVLAAKEARFSPTLLSGQPVKITGEINYNFALAK
jgi:TonB family protein